MAVDTREKRASALSVGSPFLVQLPLPDSTVGTQDRPQVLWTYSGITISAQAVSLDDDQATQLGPDGVPNAFFPDDVAVNPNQVQNLDECVYLSLICDRAVTINAAIDSDYVALSTPIEATETLETLICTRTITISSDIDDSDTVLETIIGCE